MGALAAVEGRDFRSDTVTKPTPAIGEAMWRSATDAGATGDDVMGEDATVSALEARVAALLGKESAVFVPTCTMANLIAVGAHCARGHEVLLGTESHIFVYEQGGASWLMGAPFHAVANAADGTLPLEAVAAALAMRGDGSDSHHARPGLICIENTANRCGGAALPVAYVDALGALARGRGVPLHCDGARILNAATALRVPVARLVAACDSVSLCLSKGVGGPLGALLAGAAPLVAAARRLRKAVGGGMRQAGVVAAAGMAALDETAEGACPALGDWPRLGADHARARRAAEGLRGVPGVEPQFTVDSNIVYFALGKTWGVGHWRARTAAARAAARADCDGAPLDAVPEGADVAGAFKALLLAVAGVKVGTYGTTRIRVVTHHQVGDDAVEALVEGTRRVAALLCPLGEDGKP
jgi:threonine aldolase